MHIIPASEGCFYILCELNFLFSFFLFSFVNEHSTMSSHPHQWLCLLSQIFYDGCTSAPDSPYSYALSVHVGSTLLQIFCFCFHNVLFFYYFLLFHFYFQDIFCLQVCGHTYHTFYTIVLYCLLYMPKASLFQLFPLFIFNSFILMI